MFLKLKNTEKLLLHPIMLVQIANMACFTNHEFDISFKLQFLTFNFYIQLFKTSFFFPLFSLGFSNFF